MPKQTFTTGQVLTAAQMTSLQQTAMLGGAASAKTASYTLVAADAGGAISMSNASATTITVNTGLFAAGDTVQITNLGAGVCTITSGSATVNSSASLALAQYESGTLDFTSTSAAIFIKGAGAVASSGGMTLISTTALTGASTITISSIPTTGYKDLRLVLINPAMTNDNAQIRFRPNNISTVANYLTQYTNLTGTGATSAGDDSLMYLLTGLDNTVIQNLAICHIYNYAETTRKILQVQSVGVDATTTDNFRYMNQTVFAKDTAAISSFTLISTGGNFNGGNAYVYGVN